jgi:hypothetical protein
MGITLRTLIDMITRVVVQLMGTPPGTIRTCTTGIANPFTAAVITAATPIKSRCGIDPISDLLPFDRLLHGGAKQSAKPERTATSWIATFQFQKRSQYFLSALKRFL